MKVDDLAAQIPGEWQSAFRRFVQTGEAEQDFLAVMDSDQRIQSAVDEVLAEQAGSFRQLTEALAPTAAHASRTVTEPTNPMISKIMTDVLDVTERASALAEEDLAKFVHRAGPALNPRAKSLLKALAES